MKAEAVRGEEGREGRKLILKFPSCEIEAHVPIMKYFLPFHGSSVIPDGREPGKTDPPPSLLPPTAFDRTGRDKQGPHSAGYLEHSEHPYTAQHHGEAFAPTALCHLLQIQGNPHLQGHFCTALFPPLRPQGCGQAGPHPPLSNSHCFHLLFKLCSFSSSSKFN